MILLILAIVSCVYTQQPEAGRLYDTVKGKLKEAIVDFPNKGSKIAYGIRDENTREFYPLSVSDRSFMDVNPNELVRAPVVKEGNILKVVSYVRPMTSDDNYYVGSGGVNGLGIPLFRYTSHSFVRQIYPQYDYSPRSHSKMSTQGVVEKSLAILLINFRSKPLQASVTKNLVSDWIFDGQDNVDKLYNDCTSGQIRFPKSKSVILGPYTIDDPNDAADTMTWLNQVQQLSTQVSAREVNVVQYDHMIMILPSFSSADDGASGLALVGPECGNPCPVWINTGLYGGPYFVGGISTVGHEIGHNLGWSHSGVPADGGYKVPRPGSSIEAEYGDWSALMGNGPPICPNFPHQLARKWVTATQVVGSNLPSAALSPFGSPKPNTLQGLIVMTKPQTTYISYRSIVGPDGRFTKVDVAGRGSWSNAVYIHVDKGADGKGTTAIAKLGPGETFTQGLTSITFKSIDNGVAYVSVSINDKDDCIGNPCGPNGQCVDQVGSYLCQCKPGFVGAKCQSQVCSKFNIQGFNSGSSFLNGVWDRLSDYGGKLAYKAGEVYLYFVAPNLWVFGPDLGGSSYYALGESTEDTPQAVSSWRTSGGGNQFISFKCDGGAPPTPTQPLPPFTGTGVGPRTGTSTGTGTGSGSGPVPGATNCYGSWSEWTQCSASCNGVQTRTYTILIPASRGGVVCPSVDGQTEQRSCSAPCTDSKDCVGQWGPWGPCTNSCGGGFRGRMYYISTTAANGGKPCAEQDGKIQTEKCNTQACGGFTGTGSGTGTGVKPPQPTPPIGPTNCYGLWSDWGSCSASCDGTQTRKYTIYVPNNSVGTPCPAVDGQVEKRSCGPSCGGAGGAGCVGAWGPWGPCSSSCGGGYRGRIYQVSSGKCPVENGKIETERCNTQTCSRLLDTLNKPTAPTVSPGIIIASACIVAVGIIIGAVIVRRRRVNFKPEDSSVILL